MNALASIVRRLVVREQSPRLSLSEHTVVNIADQLMNNEAAAQLAEHFGDHEQAQELREYHHDLSQMAVRICRAMPVRCDA